MDDIDAYELLAKSCPPSFSRVKIVELLGGLLSVGRLANLDSEGKGPQGRIMIGKKVGYIREPFFDWLRARDKASAKASAKPKSQE